MAEKINDKQRRFCDEYLIDLNATQAAIRTGYSPKSANKIANNLMNKPVVKEYIAARMAEKESKLIADQDEVLKYLTAVLRGKSYSSVLSLCGNGCQEVIEKEPDEKERLKAAELLGKRYGLFTEKIDQTVDMDLNVVVNYGDQEYEAQEPETPNKIGF
jgi:phage terminase small subunit